MTDSDVVCVNDICSDDRVEAAALKQATVTCGAAPVEAAAKPSRGFLVYGNIEKARVIHRHNPTPIS